MLPIANRKTLQVPHGLAALAAVICLVLAFVTDHSAGERNLHAEQTGTSAPIEQVVDENGANHSPQPAKRERRDRRERQGSLTLLPWFPVPGGGR